MHRDDVQADLRRQALIFRGVGAAAGIAHHAGGGGLISSEISCRLRQAAGWGRTRFHAASHYYDSLRLQYDE